MPKTPALDFAPDLAVEVLSPSNTQQEMNEKLADYFSSGVRLVWYVDPQPKQVRVYTAADSCETLSADEVLDGGEVLPGFRLGLKTLFAGPGGKS